MTWGKKTNKYGNKRTEVDGINFHSKKEANRYGALKLLERGRAISDLRLQPRFKLFVNEKLVTTYVGDFSYQDGGLEVVEDTKGFETADFKIKWALAQALHPQIVWRKT